MPQKHKPRLNFNLKSQIPNRVERTNVGATPAPNVVVKVNHGTELESNLSDDMPLVLEVPLPTNEFGVPTFNTTIRMHGEMNALQNVRVTITNDPPPNGQAVIAPNVTKKLNFAPSVVVFKDLTSLNVNDSLYEAPQPKVGGPTKAKSKNTENQPKEPELSEYLEKLDSFRVSIPEPELDMDFPYKEFDFLSAYRKVYGYE